MDPNSPNKPAGNPTVKELTSKSLRALMALKAAEAERRKTVKQQMEELEKAAAQEMTLARQAARQRRKKAEAQMRQRLGGMALAALRRQGLSGVLLTADDVLTLRPALIEQLQSLIVAHDDEPAADLDRNDGSGELVDIDVDRS